MTTINLICSHCRTGGSDTAALDIAIASAIAAFLLAVYAARGLREARKANALPGYLDFFREYRQYEPDRRYVLGQVHPPLWNNSLAY
jgi:hypothetical protein